jgi:hypothetical protein
MAGGNARVLADHREGETGVKVLDALEVGNLLVREADREGTDVALEMIDASSADKREDVCSRNAARRSAGGQGGGLRLAATGLTRRLAHDVCGRTSKSRGHQRRVKTEGVRVNSQAMAMAVMLSVPCSAATFSSAAEIFFSSSVCSSPPINVRMPSPACFLASICGGTLNTRSATALALTGDRHRKTDLLGRLPAAATEDVPGADGEAKLAAHGQDVALKVAEAEVPASLMATEGRGVSTLPTARQSR